MNVQRDDDHSASRASFFSGKEAQLLAFKKQQEALAEKLFPLSSLEPLPPWASPQEIEEKKQDLQTQLTTVQQQKRLLMEQQIAERKTIFQVQRAEIMKKEELIRKSFRESSPPDTFAQEKKNIETKTTIIADEEQRIQGLIAKTEQLFKKGAK